MIDAQGDPKAKCADHLAADHWQSKFVQPKG